MKSIATLSMAVILSASGTAFAQPTEHKGMDMKGMDMKQCSEMMKGMDMKQCSEMMKGMGTDRNAQGSEGTTQSAAVHQATGVVKTVDAGKGMVTLVHEPVNSLKWPAMTMGFAVKDKSLFDKLAVGKKVDVTFKQEGSGYVVTAVK